MSDDIQKVCIKDTKFHDALADYIESLIKETPALHNEDKRFGSTLEFFFSMIRWDHHGSRKIIDCIIDRLKEIPMNEFF